ncbi:hypothetical protein ACFLYD_08380 [Chloroflexota bacterium]
MGGHVLGQGLAQGGNRLLGTGQDDQARACSRFHGIAGHQVQLHLGAFLPADLAPGKDAVAVGPDRLQSRPATIV